jgi:prevent-host-death family protein
MSLAELVELEEQPTVGTVSVRELKNNPSVALRQAREGIVLVTNRDEPQAVLIDLKQLGLPTAGNIRLALATALFKQGTVSLGYAARLAGMRINGFSSCLRAMQIPLVRVTEEDLDHDMAVYDAAFQK